MSEPATLSLAEARSRLAKRALSADELLESCRARIERHVEMMLARERAHFSHVGEHAPHHSAQRLLGQQIVADVVDGHCSSAYPRGKQPSRFRPFLLARK